MLFINETETIGQIISAGTSNFTGTIVITLFSVLLVVMAIAMMFGIPLEFMAVLVLPFCLVVGAFYGNFIIPITLIVLYFASILAKHWLFR
jgi:hypothetical protein